MPSTAPGLIIDISDLVESFPELESGPLAPVAPSSAVVFAQSPRGRFIRRSPRFGSAVKFSEKTLRSLADSVLGVVEISITMLVCIWVYAVYGTVRGGGLMEPGLSTSFRFFVILACFRSVLVFSEKKTIRNSLAPIFYLSAFIVAVIAAPDDDAVALDDTIVGNFRALVLARAILVWLAFLSSKLILSYCVDVL